jgi:cell division protein FtsI (penicillin-binding protein 3)
VTTYAAAANAPRVRMPAQRPDALALTYHRLMLMMLVFAGVTSLIVGRLIYLQLFTERGGNGAAANPLLPSRADLVDRNGATLARTISAWSIGVHPKKLIGDPAELAVKLAALMPEKSAADYERILKSDKTFVYLKRRALPQLVSAVNALGEPGIGFDREPERLYPNLGLAAHIIGYTNLDGVGEAGMERALNDRLTREDLRGDPVALSLDAKVQHALEAELSAAMTKFSAVGAAGIIMDIHTGEILAMTSLPELNPNAPGKGTDEQRFNRATLGVYELGSTFKPFTVAMAMDAGIVKSLGQIYPCGRGLSVGRFTITDTHPFGRPCSVAEIMQESSNIGTAQIAAQMGGARQKQFLEQMAFLEPVSVELKERGRPLSPGANWGEISTMTVGFGHGIAVTPLHLASGYATLLNGGIWRPATLLKVDSNRPAPKGRRVFSEDTSYKMRALLRLVVTHGTGRKADAPGYRIGGKTGSAEKYHNRSLLVTTFAGVFPMDDPRYVIVAMLDEPKGIKETHGFRTAGWNVAPVISKTVSRVAPVLGVVPDSRRDANLDEVLPYVREKKK